MFIMNATKFLGIALIFVLGSTSFAFASIDKNLKYGQRDSEVMELQEFLIDKGFLKTAPTSFFGLLTLKAVKSYQISAGVSSTGFVGALTREKINKEIEIEIASSNEAEIKETGIVTNSVATETAKETKVCQSGKVIFKNEDCIKTCPDGETIIENLTCRAVSLAIPTESKRDACLNDYYTKKAIENLRLALTESQNRINQNYSRDFPIIRKEFESGLDYLNRTGRADKTSDFDHKRIYGTYESKTTELDRVTKESLAAAKTLYDNEVLKIQLTCVR